MLSMCKSWWIRHDTSLLEAFMYFIAFQWQFVLCSLQRVIKQTSKRQVNTHGNSGCSISSDVDSRVHSRRAKIGCSLRCTKAEGQIVHFTTRSRTRNSSAQCMTTGCKFEIGHKHTTLSQPPEAAIPKQEWGGTGNKFLKVNLLKVQASRRSPADQ